MRKVLLFFGALTGVVVGVALLILVIALGLGYSYLDHFAQSAQEPKLVLVKRFADYFQTYNQQQKLETQTFLVLGLDTLDTRENQPPLTDTMMLVKVWPGQSTVGVLSLPRDIYLDNLGFKINSIYAAGLERQKKQPDLDPLLLVQSEISKLTGQSIDKTIIFTLEDVSTLVDALGGMPIEVETGFTDPMFPNPSVDTTQVKDAKLLYQTVKFDPGREVMTGERVLQYIRSRHSTGPQGGDLARNQRQQQVMAALITKLADPGIFNSPELLGQLYRLYHQKFEHQLPPQLIIQLISSLGQIGRVPQLKRTNISLYPDDPNGLLYHPPERLYGGAWVFVIRDQEKFKQAIDQSLQP